MGTVNVVLGEDTRLNLILGQQLENAVTSVVFDFSAWQTTYGAGTLALSVQRPGDEMPYAVTLTTSGTDATWSVTNLDTAYKGVGHIQLTYTVGAAIKKSVVYKFTVYESLGANGEYPSPGQTWQEEMEEELADVKEDLAELEGGGITPVAQSLLINILRNGVYKTDQSTNITNLETELASGGGGATTVAIINTLTNCTSNNSASSISVGSSYIATITANEGYDIDTITVLMDGVDVTANVLYGSTITIPNVTGTLNITAMAFSQEESRLAHYWDLTSGSLVDTIDGETEVILKGSASISQNTGVKITFADGHLIIPFTSPNFKRMKIVFGEINFLGNAYNNSNFIGGRNASTSTSTKALRYSASEDLWETGSDVSTGIQGANVFANKELIITRGTSNNNIINIEFNGNTIVDGYTGGVGYNYIAIENFYEVTIKSIKTYTE